MQFLHTTAHLQKTSQFTSPLFIANKLRKKLCFLAAKLAKRYCFLLFLLCGLLIFGVFCSLIFNSFSSTAHDRTENSFSSIYVSNAARHQPLNSSVLLWVMTAPKFHDTRLRAVNATWLHRLQHAVVFTSERLGDERIPYRAVFNGFDDSYEKVFNKAKFGFYYAYMNISQKFDWYIRADDNTYVLTENLNRFLVTLDPNKPIYAGYKWTHVFEKGHNSGSFYILSRAAMQIFAERLYHDEKACPFDEIEDVGISRCLASAGIYPMETKNARGQQRFQPADAIHAYSKEEKNSFDVFPIDLISIHNMEPRDMITADLFHYRLK